MVWPRVKEGRGGYHQEDVKHASAGKEKKGRPNIRWFDNTANAMKEYKLTKDMAQNRNAWHMKATAGPLLHGGLWREGWRIGPTTQYNCQEWDTLTCCQQICLFSQCCKHYC